MVEQHTLSLRREEVGGTEGVDDLLDAGVLIDASLTGQRVAYAHPILFDHAVSTFLIGAGPRGWLSSSPRSRRGVSSCGLASTTTLPGCG